MHLPNNRPVEDVLAEVLSERGYTVVRQRGVPSDQTVTLDTRIKPGGKVKLALVSDEHLCSKHQQLTTLRHFLQYAKEQGCEAIISGGDTVDGGRMHADQEFELFVHGYTAQLDYAVDHLPNVGLPWYRVDGNHDYAHWQQAGASFGQGLADRRADVTFLGYGAATLRIGPLDHYVMHGSGGVAYARSYKVQRITENLTDEIRQRGIRTFQLGHYHVSAMIPSYRGICAIQMPSFQSQTPYLKRKGLRPEIGGVVFEVEFTRKWELWNVRTDWRFYEPRANDF